MSAPIIKVYTNGTPGAQGPAGPPGPSGGAPEIAATRAAINASTVVRFIYVTTDETNNGDASLYFYNGTSLKFIQTIQ